MIVSIAVAITAIVVVAAVAVTAVLVKAITATQCAKITADANKYAADQARQAKETAATEKTKRQEMREKGKMDRQESRRADRSSAENQYLNAAQKLREIDAATSQLWSGDSAWHTQDSELNWDYGYDSYGSGHDSGRDLSADKAKV